MAGVIPPEAFPQGRSALAARMEAGGLIAIIRSDAPADWVDVCRSLRDGGVEFSEITMNTPGALESIARVHEKLGKDCVIGAGTVLDGETARAAIMAGAQFIVAPTLNLGVIEMAHRYARPVIPGALTPTEILAAWEGGADFVKVFPANLFGPQYFKDVMAPLPQVKLMATGGVDLKTAPEWLNAGAACLGLGSTLLKKDLIKARDWAGLTALARQFVEVVRRAREG